MVPALAAHPHVKRLPSTLVPGQSPFSCEQEFEGFYCYSPDQIRRAYSIQPLLDRGKDGRGPTIVIVDAYAVPGIREDLTAFDAPFGPPDPRRWPSPPPLPHADATLSRQGLRRGRVRGRDAHQPFRTGLAVPDPVTRRA